MSKHSQDIPLVEDIEVAKYLNIDAHIRKSHDVQLCRLCGMKIESGDSIDICMDSLDLCVKINRLLPVSISQHDDLPKNICPACFDKVTFIEDFASICMNNDKKLREVAKARFGSCDDSKNNILGTEDNTSKIYSESVYVCPSCEVVLEVSQNGLIVVGNFEITDSTLGKVRAKSEKLFKRNRAAAGIRNSKNPSTIITEDDPAFIANATKRQNKTSTDTCNVNTSETLEGRNREENISGDLTYNIKKKPREVLVDEKSAYPFKMPKFEKGIFVNDLPIINEDLESKKALVKSEPLSIEDWSSTEADCILAEISNNNPDFFEEATASVSNISEFSESGKHRPKMTCDKCGARYVSQVKYEFHMERHNSGSMETFVCPLCGKESVSENLLWDHYVYMHKRTLRYVCDTCGKLYHKQSKLKVHQLKNGHSGVQEIHVETDANGVTMDTSGIQKALMKDGSIVMSLMSVNCVLCGEEVSGVDPDGINDAVTCTSCEGSGISLKIDPDGAKVIMRRQYHCSMCPKHFGRKDRLEFHEMRHSENMNECVCSSCGKVFCAENALFEHYLYVHKGARPHVCETCGKSFQLKARLKEHFRTHTGERPFQCDVCGQRCTTNNLLKLHQKKHLMEKRFGCQICGKAFSKKQNLNLHLERHWKNDGSMAFSQLFVCPFCMDNLPTFRILKHHMMEIHGVDSQDPILSDQKPWYDCEDCHEKFKHQMSLKAHRERIHERRISPVFSCDVCGVTYRTKQLLATHIKNKHDEDKRYKCALCGKQFNDTKSMHNHIMLHTGEKPYSCEHCGLTFRRKDSRDQHQRKHTGEQPYKCSECEETFMTTNQRTKHHQREHRKKGGHQCLECGRVCFGQREIRIHLNMHLGEKLEKLQENAT